MFRNKKSNPFYEKLERINKRQSFVKTIKRAFYLGGFVFTPEGCDLVQQAIVQNRLRSFLDEFHYNTQEDNIELYLVEDDCNQLNVVITLDPVELYEKEKVLKVISVNHFLIEEIEAEQIYP